MEVKITKDFIEHLNESINQQNAKAVKEMLQDLHPADIAELFDELSTKEQSFVIDLLDNEISADILLELEEDDRRKFLKTLTAKEIAEDVITEMETDDAPSRHVGETTLQELKQTHLNPYSKGEILQVYRKQCVHGL